MDDNIIISDDAIRRFQEVTNGSRKQAMRFLARFDNDVNIAVGAFLDSGEMPESEPVYLGTGDKFDSNTFFMRNPGSYDFSNGNLNLNPYMRRNPF